MCATAEKPEMDLNSPAVRISVSHTSPSSDIAARYRPADWPSVIVHEQQQQQLALSHEQQSEVWSPDPHHTPASSSTHGQCRDFCPPVDWQLLPKDMHRRWSTPSSSGLWSETCAGMKQRDSDGVKWQSCLYATKANLQMQIHRCQQLYGVISANFVLFLQFSTTVNYKIANLKSTASEGN